MKAGYLITTRSFGALAATRQVTTMRNDLDFEIINDAQHDCLGCVNVRTPRVDDIREIIRVVRACEPILTAHISYIYWMYIRYYRDTCAVAELNGTLVGWCSVAAVAKDKYFSHQSAVDPAKRGRGVGTSLWAYVLDKIARSPAFQLEFTIERSNSAALRLMQGVADRAGMFLHKTQETAQLLEEGCAEEMYVMSPSSRHRDGFARDAHKPLTALPGYAVADEAVLTSAARSAQFEIERRTGLGAD